MTERINARRDFSTHGKHAEHHPYNNSKICIANPLTLLFGHNNPATYQPDWMRISQDENPEGVRSPISSFLRIEIAVSALRPQTGSLQVNPRESAKVLLPSCGVAFPSNYPMYYLAFSRISFLSSFFPIFSTRLSFSFLTIVLHLCGKNMPIFCRRNLTS